MRTRVLSALLDLPQRAVLHQDDAIVVVDKPAGIPCQSPDATQPEDLPSLLRRRLARERGVPAAELYLGTHQRLDQDTSGVLVYSAAKVANASLAEQFAARSVEKLYLAAVSGRPPAPGTLLSDYVAPAEGGLMRVVPGSARGAKQARTRVLGVRSEGGRSLLTLQIETGRTHQIRLQLAAAGCPIAGDPWYGGAPALRLLLHAARLGLQHPTRGERMTFESPAPPEFECFLRGTTDPFADPQLLQRALALAAHKRVGLLPSVEAAETDSFRWLHGAADGVPDVYIDVYDRQLVVRVDGDERQQHERQLAAVLEPFGFAGAQLKRHPRQANVLVDPNDDAVAPRAPLFGGPAPDTGIVKEHGMPFEVHLAEGLRSGLFLDQRDNRARLRELSKGKRVLNLFGYTGSFSVAALLGGAAWVLTVDVSRAALEWAGRNVERIGCSERHRSLAEDVFVALRGFASKGQRFDCIVLDPPSYSTTKRGRFRAAKDYASLCEAALAVMDDEGVLLACLNHQGMSRAQLRRDVQRGALAAGLRIVSLQDQPVQRDFPASHGEEPAMKSVIARLSRSPRMHSPSASMNTRMGRS